jgi:hypothetical protein
MWIAHFVGSLLVSQIRQTKFETTGLVVSRFLAGNASMIREIQFFWTCIDTSIRMQGVGLARCLLQPDGVLFRGFVHPSPCEVACKAIMI